MHFRAQWRGWPNLSRIFSRRSRSRSSSRDRRSSRSPNRRSFKRRSRSSSVSRSNRPRYRSKSPRPRSKRSPSPPRHRRKSPSPSLSSFRRSKPSPAPSKTKKRGYSDSSSSSSDEGQAQGAQSKTESKYVALYLVEDYVQDAIYSVFVGIAPSTVIEGDLQAQKAVLIEESRSKSLFLRMEMERLPRQDRDHRHLLPRPLLHRRLHHRNELMLSTPRSPSRATMNKFVLKLARIRMRKIWSWIGTKTKAKRNHKMGKTFQKGAPCLASNCKVLHFSLQFWLEWWIQ